MRIGALLVAVAVLAGCLGGDARDAVGELSACPVPPGLTIPVPGASYAPATDPAQRYDTLLFLPDQKWPYIDSFTTPVGWFFGHQNLNFANASSTLVRLSADPIVEGGDPTEPSNVRAQPGRFGVAWADQAYVEDACRIVDTGAAYWDLAPPAIGDQPQPGQGVHVHAAGFWENGTLFWTNIEEIHASDWPRAGWYEWGGGDALPVYVYDESADEQPAVWNPPPDPVTGAQPWAYYTTIKGFNDGLKDASTRTGRVVHMPPEDAYTRPGNEEHDLFGDPLIFYIVLGDVVDVPCPDVVATQEACRVPAVQGAPIA